MDVRVGLWRKLSAEELMLLNCGVGEDFWESLGLQGDPTSPFWRRSALGFLWKDAKAETPVLWPPHVKSWLIGKDSDAGRDWEQEEKGTTEDEITGWHHWLDGRESGWSPGVCDGQEGLACCDSWGRKESDTTEWLNWTELIHLRIDSGAQLTLECLSPFLIFVTIPSHPSCFLSGEASYIDKFYWTSVLWAVTTSILEMPLFFWSVYLFGLNGQ